jgi:hypothetical protein
MLELYWVMIDLESDDHIFFKCHFIFLGIAAAQPRRFVDTQSNAVKSVKPWKFS